MITLKTDVDVRFSGITLTGDVDHLPEQRALMLTTDEGSEVLSIDTGEQSPRPPHPNEVHIKDYSEHTGVAESLEEAGIVELIGKYTVGPFHSPIYIAEVL